MSKQQVEQAKVQGFKGPFFPKEIIELSEILPQGSLNTFDYQKIAEGVRGFVGYLKVASIGDRRTSDGYFWYAVMAFRVPDFQSGYPLEVRVLIPWSTDSDLTDGSPADRMIALYYQESFPQGKLKDLLREINEVAKRHLVDNQRRS